MIWFNPHAWINRSRNDRIPDDKMKIKPVNIWYELDGWEFEQYQWDTMKKYTESLEK